MECDFGSDDVRTDLYAELREAELPCVWLHPDESILSSDGGGDFVRNVCELQESLSQCFVLDASLGSDCWCKVTGKSLREDPNVSEIRTSKKKWRRRECMSDTRLLTNDSTIESALCRLLVNKDTITRNCLIDALKFAMDVKKEKNREANTDWSIFQTCVNRSMSGDSILMRLLERSWTRNWWRKEKRRRWRHLRNVRCTNMF